MKPTGGMTWEQFSSVRDDGVPRSTVEHHVVTRNDSRSRALVQFLTEHPRVQAIVKIGIRTIGPIEEPDFVKWFSEDPTIEPTWARARERVRLKRGDELDPYDDLRHEVAWECASYSIGAVSRHKHMRGLAIEVFEFALSWIQTGRAPTEIALRSAAFSNLTLHSGGEHGGMIYLPPKRVLFDITNATREDVMLALEKRDKLLGPVEATILPASKKKAYTEKVFEIIRIRFPILRDIPRRDRKVWEPVYEAVLEHALEDIAEARELHRIPDVESISNFLDRYYRVDDDSWRLGSYDDQDRFRTAFQTSVAEINRAVPKMWPE